MQWKKHASHLRCPLNSLCSTWLGVLIEHLQMQQRTQSNTLMLVWTRISMCMSMCDCVRLKFNSLPVHSAHWTLSWLFLSHHLFCLFFSRPQFEGWPHHGPTFSVYLCPVILSDSSMGSPVHVLMLTIQATRGLPRLRAPGIVPCIISFSR